MKVKELISFLKTHDPNAEVICQSDGEGNSYSPLYGIYEGGYLAENAWSGEFRIKKLTKAMRNQGFSEEDVDPDALNAIFLVPTR